ncbi:MAG: alpha/beta hydrolase [Bacteroidetes bacterium]|nr:alpha/beta hydrolase [Bacteroidota bacterium]
MNLVKSIPHSEKTNKKIVYLLKGVGSTDEVFKFLQFDESFKPIIVQWVKPNQQESVSEYAKRLLPQISDPEPIFIGLSFGGIIAHELSEHFEKAYVILISSVKNKSEMPLSHLGKYKYLLKLFSTKHLKRYEFIQNLALRAYAPAHRPVVESMIKNLDTEFNDWAIESAIHWNKTTSPKHVIHIHGTDDILFPISKITNPIKVQGGSHFMIVEKSEQVSNHIKYALKELLKDKSST